MASHHHFRRHPATTSASCYCHCYHTPHTHCHQHHNHPPTSPPQDSNFHFSSPPQPHPYSVQSHIQYIHHRPHIQEGYFHEEQRIHPTVSSLLSRVADLESALRRRSSLSPFSSSHLLRDAAARIIQTHFRAFLLRRSRTLRQLKDLASIKSTLRLLKSSIYEKTHFDHGVLYDKSMDLLLKLESVQGGDPMIRDGRNSISRELNQFLDWIDAVCVGRRGLSSNVRCGGNSVKTRVLNGGRIGNMKCGGLKGINEAKLKGLVEKIDKLAEELEEESDSGESLNLFLTRNQVTSGNRSGILAKQHGGSHPKVTKNVRFADNGKAYRVSRIYNRTLLEEDYCDDSMDDRNLDDAERQLEDDLCREVEVMGVSSKDGEENHPESGGSLPSSDGEKGLGNKSNYKAEDFVFAAPLPVKMEMRDDLIGKRM
ncbi:BAG family molecular chaperone regulator 8, chloroplastic-like [Primulina tabacum]|uniref:BAG family molecular chaperone regulator 8, chloroplastic-like n=1 Tax=Primulina tabacum TaxID=48773 RepID=UPI003F5A36EC